MSHDPAGHLIVMNLAATVLLFLGLLLPILARRRRAITEEALRRVWLPVVVSVGLWVVEYAMLLLVSQEGEAHTQTNKTPSYIDFVLNSLIAVGFSVSGWSLFRLKDRAFEDAPSPSRPSGFILLLDSELSKRTTIAVAVLLIVGALIASFIMKHADVRILDIISAEHVQAGSACLGMLLLGTGLFREFTREKTELIAIWSAGSVISYAVLQLFQVIENTESFAWVFTRTTAVALKVAFLVSVTSYWTLVSEIARRREEASLLQRFLSEWRRTYDTRIHNSVQNAIKSALGRQTKVQECLSSGNIARAKDHLFNAESCLKRATSEIEHLLEESFDLDPSPVPARRRIVRELRTRLNRAKWDSGIEYSLTCDAELTLPAMLAEAIVQIAVEAINNAERHSDCKKIWLTVALTDDEVWLEVRDNGRGFNVDPKPRSRGLPTMNWLARERGGTFTPVSSSSGTIITARMPLEDE